MSHLNVFQGAGVHFVAVTFIRPMLACEVNIGSLGEEL